MSKIKNLYYRFYNDYVVGDRKLPLYANTIEHALKSGYHILTVIDYYQKKISKEIYSEDRTIVCRHDIDTDPHTARKIFEIEKILGIKSTYYFRLSTIDVVLMNEIHNYGSEVGYHYEEIATYAKRHKMKTRDEVIAAIPKIQAEFIDNFHFVQNTTGIKMRTVCSHGDFANRYLKTYNWELIDSSVRESCKLLAEAYDSIVKESCLNISDGGHGYSPWTGGDPMAAIDRGVPKIYLLTHPRSWNSSFRYNTKENLTRMFEGIKYSF